jgi:hypothetical protein
MAQHQLQGGVDLVVTGFGAFGDAVDSSSAALATYLAEQLQGAVGGTTSLHHAVLEVSAAGVDEWHTR